MAHEDIAYGFILGERFAHLEHRVSALEKILKVDLDKLAKDLFSDAATTDAAVSDNPVPASNLTHEDLT